MRPQDQGAWALTLAIHVIEVVFFFSEARHFLLHDDDHLEIPALVLLTVIPAIPGLLLLNKPNGT